MAEEQTIFIPSTSGDDLAMNNALSNFLAGTPLKITQIKPDSITRGRKKTHGWRITIQTD